MGHKILGIVFGVLLIVQVSYANQNCSEGLASYQFVTNPQKQYEAGEELIKLGCSDAAVVMWEKAAKMNHPEALFKLGIWHQGGDRGMGGVRANPKKAFGYFLRAAELQNTDAMFMAALHYENGTKFVKKDPKIAWGLYLKAAEKRNKLATQRVIDAYQKGDLGQTQSLEQVNLWKNKLNLD